MTALACYGFLMLFISSILVWLEHRSPYATRSQTPRSSAVLAVYRRVPFYNVAAMAVLWYLLDHVGLASTGLIPVGALIHASSPVSAVATVLLLWLIYSGVDGTLHYLRHRSDLLWLVHRTHHSDTAMDISTTVFRSGSEILFNLVAFFTLFGAIVSAPWWAIMSAFGIESAMQLIHHANFRPSPRVLATIGRVIQLPPHHRMHHSRSHSGYFWTFQPYNYLYALVNPAATPSVDHADDYRTGFHGPVAAPAPAVRPVEPATAVVPPRASKPDRSQIATHGTPARSRLDLLGS